MRRNWFRNRVGRKNSKALSRGQVGKSRIDSRAAFFGALERLEDRRLLVVWNITGDLLANRNDTLLLQQDGSGNDVAILNGVTVLTAPSSTVTQINFNALTGNDTLTVDSSNGLVAPTDGIHYDGGAGFDSLTLQQSGGPTILSDQLAIGASSGSGLSTITDTSHNVQNIYYQNLEPVNDFVPSPNFSISGGPGATILDADNAINYVAFLGDGFVSIDNAEPIAFSSKDHLLIDAGAGNDTINIAGGTAPAGDTLASLADITVTGGDPSGIASDTLIVEGQTSSDSINYSPSSTIGSGTVQVNSDPAILFNTVESVVIDGQGSGDMLHVVTPAGGNSITYTPGATVDSGTIDITGSASNNTTLVPLTFQHLGTNAVVTFNTNSDSPEDTLTVYGTNSSDFFEMIGTTGELISSFSVGIATPGIDNLNLKGLAGNDIFLVYGPQPFEFLGIDGGDPSGTGSDIVSLQGATGNVTADFGDTIGSTPGAEVDGYGSTISMIGVETANLDVNGHALTILGFLNQPDSISYTPTGAGSGTVSDAGFAPVYNFANVSTVPGFFVIDPQAGSDTVTVNGTAGNDNIVVTKSGLYTMVTVNGMLGATILSADAASLDVNGLTGDDSLTVDSSNGAVAIPITYDGGVGHDSLTLTGGTAISDTYSPGPIAGSGNISLDFSGNLTEVVNFLNLEPVTDDVTAIAAIVNGTDANNAINYTEGNSDTGEGLVTVDDQEGYYFSNKTHLYINAGAGDDVINLNNPSTPPGLIDITVTGGDPTASDTLIVNGTSGMDTFDYNPATIGTGAISNSGLQPPLYFDGIEAVTIDGQGGGDSLHVVTPSGGNYISYTPGAAPDSGTIAVTNSLSINTALVPLTFQHIGTSGSVTFNTNNDGPDDVLTVYGTNNSDIFNVTGSSGQVQITDTSATAVTDVLHTDSIIYLKLDSLDGDDIFRITGPLSYDFVSIDGGDPSASDIVNLSGANGPVSAHFGDSASSSPLAGVDGYGSPIALAGVEVVNLDVNGQTLTINGTDQPDAIIYTPTGAQAGTVNDAGFGPVCNFTNVSSAAGAFTIDPGTGGSNTVTVNGTAGNDNIVVTKSGANTVVTVNSMLAANVVTADTASLVIDGLAGDDSLAVDSSNGAVAIPIVYDGGTGTNSLLLSGGTATADTYTPGSQLGSGTNALTFASGSELINFLNLAPIIDTVISPLTVNGTDGDNAINYTSGVGLSPLVYGLVNVDNYEPITFSNKTTLTINSGAGDDVINLNNPGTPTGLTGISVNGGDPTASDTLIVNGTTGNDTINYSPSATIGSGTVQVNALPLVTFNTIERLTIDGQRGADALTITTPAGENQISYTPGSATDSGVIAIQSVTGNTAEVPLTFQHIGFDGITFANTSGNRTDILDLYGTNNDDSFSVDGLGFVSILSPHTNSFITNLLRPTGIAQLVLLGLQGDDTFFIASNFAFPGFPGLGMPGLIVQGGDPSASDVLDFFADGGPTTNLVTADLGAATIAEATFGTVHYTGIEVVNLEANGHSVAVMGTTGNDSLAVTPTASDSATLQDYTGGTAQNGQGGTLATMTPFGPVFNFSGVSTASGGFAVDGNGGSDQLFVEGMQNADTIDVNDGASGANAVKVNSLLVVNYNSTMAHVEVDSLAGSDTINIAPSTTTTFLVDGGDPIGVLPGDTINLLHPVGFYQIFPGPTKDSGGLNTAGGYQTISWIHIETVVNTGGSPIITGTNGDDIITIIARDSSYNPANPGVPNPALDGIQDFTVSVNDGPDMLFINTPNLLVDALAGNDQIHVHEPAPNNAAWNVQIWVAGGTPSAGTGNVGDLIELETPGMQNVTYAPDVTAPALAGVTFGANSPTDTAQFNDTTNTSKITAVSSFQIAGFYQSSPGGIEQFVYQGDAGNDNLTYLTPSLPSGANIAYTPGATQDSGTITASTLGTGSFVPLVFQGLGISTNTITFNSSNGRVDTLTVNGTAANESFTVTGSGDAGAGTVQVGTYATVETLVLNTPGIAQLNLQGLGGADYFYVSGPLPYSITSLQGSDPIANLSGATGPVTVNLGNNSLSTLTTITGYGGTVTLVGIDTANLDANSNTVSVNGTTQPEAFTFTPTDTAAGTLTDSGINTVFNFSNVSGAVSGFTLDPSGGSDTVTVNGTSSADSQTALVNGSDTTVRTNGLLAVDTVTADTESLGHCFRQRRRSTDSRRQQRPRVGADRLRWRQWPRHLAAFRRYGQPRHLHARPDPWLWQKPNHVHQRRRRHANGRLPESRAGARRRGQPRHDDRQCRQCRQRHQLFPRRRLQRSHPHGLGHGRQSGNVRVHQQNAFGDQRPDNGSDEINLNNPDTPTALTDITVNGGDPTASDTLIVNGTTGTDAINYSPSTTIGSGTVQVNALPTIFFNTIEQLKIDGQGGADNLTLTTPAGNDNVIYTPGATPDSGSMSINAIAANGVARVPVSFAHIGGSVTFASAGGREDNVDILGTNNSDVFTANGPADTVLITDRTTFNPITETLHTGGASILQLSGLGGDDVFNAIGLMQYSLILDGGDPSGSDTANLSGATGLVTVSMLNPAASSGPATLTSITGYTAGAGSVFLTGIEVANLNTSTFGLTVNGNSSPNLFSYTPTGPAAGTFSQSGINTVFNFSNTAGAFTINGSVGSTSDAVTFIGTASRDLISIDQGARTATLTNVANAVWKTVTLGPNIQVLTAQGLSGQDTFLVTPAPGTQFPQSLVNPVGNTNNLLINVDGGGNSSGENNALVIATQAGGQLPNSDFVVVNRGADNTSGTVRTYGGPLTPGPNVQYPDVNYVNIQTVSPFVGTDQNAGPFLNQPNLLILGPDLNEPNQNPVNGSPFNATFLGSGPTINVNNAAIFPNNAEFPFVPADQDYYRVVAQNTGTLDFQVYFNLFDSALFPAGGNLNIQVLDVNGNVIAAGAPASFGSVGTTANARIRIPVVQGQTYYLRVFGANTDGSQNAAVVNGYNFTIVNTAINAPGTIELSEAVPNGEPNSPLTTQGTPDTGQLPPTAPPSDSGRSQFDNVTNGGFDNTTDAAAAAAAGTSGTLPAPTGATLGKPTIYITLDDSFLLQDIPGNQTSGGVPGTSAIPINFNSSTTLVPTGPGNYRIAVYDGGNGAMSQQPGTSNNPSTAHTLDPNDGTFIGWAQPVAGVPHLYMLTIGSQGGPTGSGTGALASDTLADGIHNITARVQIIEPATSTNPIHTAFGPRSASTQITIDTVAPPVQFGLGTNQDNPITPGSDSGVVTEPETSSDLVTNVTAPTFQGQAEANSIVYLWAQITNPANPNFGKPFPQGFVFLGETVAVPLDGTNAFPNGQWTLTSGVDLNNPQYFLRDGLRTIVVQAEDLAGNKSPSTPFGPGTIINIEIDTQGPQVTDVVISDPTVAPHGTDGENLSFNLFGEKFGTNSVQAQQGPTPLVYAITINIQDLPVRVAQFLTELAFKPEVVEGQEVDSTGEFADGGLSLIGDANGRIAFTVVANPLDSPPDPNLPNTTPGAATGEIQLRFKDANGNPIALPDDRYTLTINDTAVVDPAGNKLDGESDAAEPLNNPNFPSGNGVPGGNFIARFTVDSRPELGDFAAARVYIDANGNFIYDPQNADFTNRDLTFTMQVDANLAGVAQLGVHDSVFVGKFAGAGAVLPPTGYFSKLAAYGTDPIAGPGFRWLIDTDGNGLADMYVPQSTGFSIADQNGQSVTFAGSGIAIAGEFDGNLADGDEVGLFDGSHFWLDTDHNFMIDGGDTVVYHCPSRLPDCRRFQWRRHRRFRHLADRCVPVQFWHYRHRRRLGHPGAIHRNKRCHHQLRLPRRRRNSAGSRYGWRRHHRYRPLGTGAFRRCARRHRRRILPHVARFQRHHRPAERHRPHRSQRGLPVAQPSVQHVPAGQRSVRQLARRIRHAAGRQFRSAAGAETFVRRSRRPCQRYHSANEHRYGAAGD